MFSETRRNVTGLDLAGHANHYACGLRRGDGGHDIAHFGTMTPELERLASCRLEMRGVESMAMESTSVYWVPVAELLEGRGIESRFIRKRYGSKKP